MNKDIDTASATPLQVVPINRPDAAARTEASRAANRKSRVLILPTTDGLSFERVKNIVYLEAAGNYTTVYFVNGRKVVVCKTLSDVENMLPDRAFVRIHRSHSIHLRYILKYVRGKGGHVVMHEGAQLPVASGQRDAFLAAIHAYFR